jgi:hypothetical protein
VPAALAVLLLAAAARADDLSSAACVVHFPPSARRQAERVAETFAQRRDQAASWLGIEPSSGRVEVHLVPDHDAMTREAPGAPSWAVAVTLPHGAMVFRLDLVDRTLANSLDLVLKHETVHFLLDRGRVHLPRWFEEGLCVFHAGAAYLDMDTTLERVASAGRLPRFASADRLFRGEAREAALGYRVGQRAVEEYVRRFGDEAVRGLVRAAARGAPFPDAFEEATGESLEAFERRWREEVTPGLPLWLFVIVENLDLTLLCLGALLVIAGYVRWRLRRSRAMDALGGGDGPP